MVPTIPDTIMVVIHQNDDGCVDLRISTGGPVMLCVFDECLSPTPTWPDIMRAVVPLVVALGEGALLSDGSTQW